MRIRLWDEGRLARWAAFLFWFAPASSLVFASLHPSLAIVPIASAVLGVIGVSRLSPLGLLARLWGRRLAGRLARAGRVELVGTSSVVNPLVALLGAGLFWIVPFCAGAYAEKNHAGHVVAVVLLALTTLAVWRLIFGRAAPAVTLGADGLKLPRQGFFAYEALVARSDGDELVVEEGGTAMRVEVGGQARVIAAEIARRKALAGAVAAAPAEVAVHARVAEVPPGLVATLRDGRAPRAERLRVAEVLRVSAPDEVDRFAAETADDELARSLRR